MKDRTKDRALSAFEDRVAYVVTELNGLRGSVVNQEVTEADFNSDLTQLFDRLEAVEATVTQLADIFWR